jgi:hypothetical protein
MNVVLIDGLRNKRVLLKVLLGRWKPFQSGCGRFFRNVATAILLVVRVEATSTSKFNNLKNTFVWLTE